MLHRVALVRTDVSEEYITPIIRLKTIIELGTTLSVTIKLLLELVIAKIVSDSFHPIEDGDAVFGGRQF
jgi:hypothetical protein